MKNSEKVNLIDTHSKWRESNGSPNLALYSDRDSEIMASFKKILNKIASKKGMESLPIQIKTLK